MKRVIDGHLHIVGWGEEDYISYFDKYVEEQSLRAINLCSIPHGVSNICNNIMMGFYKIARPNAYVHAGVDLLEIPLDNMPEGMNAVDQYKELMEIGFDGLKMLEGKPTIHKKIGKNLNHPQLDKLYAELEKDGTHLLMHVNDPDEFWDKDRAPGWAVDNGWVYLDGTFASYEEIHRQTVKILEDHPGIHLTLAHFFFCSKEPEILEGLFAKYPNFCVDLTAGGEMYVSFAKNYEYYKEFFNKYSDRLIFGTDRSYTCDTKYSDWLYNMVVTFLDTDKTVKCFDDLDLKGLGLSQEKRDNLLFGNFVRRVGEAPKPINKEKLKAYIEKYSFALTDEDKKRIEPLAKKYL